MFLLKALLLISAIFVLYTHEVHGNYPGRYVGKSFLNPRSDAETLFHYSSPPAFKLPQLLSVHKRYLEYMLPIGAPSIVVKLVSLIDTALGNIFGLFKKVVHAGVGIVVSLVRAVLPVFIYKLLMPRGLDQFASPKTSRAEFHRLF